MSNTLNWHEIIHARRIAKTSDQAICGCIVAEYQDSIIVIEFEASKLNEYIIPRSSVDHYDGRDVHLSIPCNLMSAFCF